MFNDLYRLTPNIDEQLTEVAFWATVNDQQWLEDRFWLTMLYDTIGFGLEHIIIIIIIANCAHNI